MVKGEDERAKRLAAALRENLKRRKAQAREAVKPDKQDQESDLASPPGRIRPAVP